MKTLLCRTSLLSFVGILFAGSLVNAADSPLAQYYGFRPIEIFKLSERSVNMLSGDLNHDGLNDVILINNEHNRLDMLIQRKQPPAERDIPIGRSDVNTVEDHWRFELRKIAVDREIAALALGDFNGDGRTDIAYFGKPDQLIIRFQPEKGEWTEKKQQRVPDVVPLPWFMTAGDMDGNGLDDLVILGKHETILFYQLKKGTLEPPKKLMNTSDKLSLAQIADLDGDGRNDLCYLAGDDSSKALGARLQMPDGQLGSEYIFDLERPRSVTLRDVDGKPGQEVLTIDSRTGRVKMLRIERRKPAPNDLPDRLIQFGFGKQGSGRDRDLAIGDFDGDGLTDVAVTDPDASRVLVFRQHPGSGLDLGTPFPGLSGADQIRATELDGDKKAELVIHSGPEKTLGISRYTDGHLTFPESLPVEPDTNGLELTDLDGDSKPEIVYITKTKKDRSSEYALQALKRAANGEWQPYQFGGSKTSVVLDLKGTPDLLMRVDIAGDARPEFLVFQGTSKPPQLFGLNSEGVPVEIATTGNLGLGAVSPGAVSMARLNDKPGLLVAQENFARHMLLGPHNRWQVDAQFNASESNSKIVGAVLADLDSEPGPEIALVDSGVKKLRVMKKMADGNYAQWKEIDIGEFPYKSIRVADLNGDKRDDLLLFGSDKMAVLYAGAAAPAVTEVASFESQLDKVYPTDIIAGDLNGDGKVDLAVTDTKSHFIEILQYRADSGLKHALYFRVFEHKSFRKDEDGGGTEPREGLCVDVTGDGLQDLLLLTHDRLILYPQDDGK